MLTQKTDSTSIMASFATLKSLSDAKKYQSPYQILREFINYIIKFDSLYSFSAVEMKNRLNSHFSFSIPEAVVKTSLKNIPEAILANGIYIISKNEVCSDEFFAKKKKEADEYEARIIQQLSEYISIRTGSTTINIETLTQELSIFLLEDVSLHSMKYLDLIGEFVLKNQHNKEIQEGMKKIREGSILYIGLSHSIGETGSIVKPLTLYLGTEIIFSLVGYNGEVFQQFADDFYDQIRTANSGKNKKIILRYFSDVKKEIDNFFGIAREIVEGRRHGILDKPAMKAITDGCCTAADVDVKKSDFYHKLQINFGITEDPNDDYYGEESFTSNLECFDYVDEEDKSKKKETAVKLISHINKLRNGARFHNDLESEHIIVTNTKATLLISQELSEKIKATDSLDRICNFAISLDRITSLLWYKLGNGFSKSDFPSSVNAVLKARIVLSASIARNAEQEFVKIKKDYAEGLIDDDQATARIITLRNKPVLPEALRGDDIDEIMNFTPEYLSRYEEQAKKNQRDLSEKDEVIKNLKAETEIKLSKKDEKIAAQAIAIENSSKENALLRDELNKYQKKEEEASTRKIRRKNVLLFACSIVCKLIVLALFIGFMNWIDRMSNSIIIDHISNVVNVAGVICFFGSVIKRDREKYLKKDSENNTNEKP